MSSSQILLPLEVNILIPKDDIYHTFSMLVELLDYSELLGEYSSLGRPIRYDPITLFKIHIFARILKIYSSRGIEDACKFDIRFKHILGGQTPPSHSTINRFKRRLQGPMEGLFKQLILLLEQFNELEFESLFIDGTKIEAYANKYTFVWKKAIQKRKIALSSNIKNLYSEIKLSYEQLTCPSGLEAEELLRLLHFFLRKEISRKEIHFVYGKGKRKTALQRWYEKADDYLKRWEQYKEYLVYLGDRNSFSKTDIDATFMHMKEDHMRNSQLKPGYNIQIGVSGEYIVHTGVFNDRGDQPTFVPFMQSLYRKYGRHFEEIVADAGYESEENYSYLEDNNLKCYIKPSNYEWLKKRNSKKALGRIENMIRDDEHDSFICANNTPLLPVRERTRITKNGYVSHSTVYEGTGCQACSVRTKCTKANPENMKTLYYSKKFIAQRKKSHENITSERGIALRMNRSIQVEGAFGVLKEDFGFRRFLCRGEKNVSLEISLLCFAYNLKKYHNKLKRGEKGPAFFAKKTA